MKYFFVILGCLLSIGCDMKKNTTEPVMISHPNGLHLSLTFPHASIKETPHGYIVQVNKEGERQQNTILIEVRPIKPDNLNLQKTVNNLVYFYSEDIYEGASGGAEKTIRIWKDIDKNNGVFIEHYYQDESRNFSELAWLLLESIYIENAKH
jgi:hypothetical protein